jgi:hypothetical protein
MRSLILLLLLGAYLHSEDIRLEGLVAESKRIVDSAGELADDPAVFTKTVYRRIHALFDEALIAGELPRDSVGIDGSGIVKVRINSLEASGQTPTLLFSLHKRHVVSLAVRLEFSAKNFAVRDTAKLERMPEIVHAAVHSDAFLRHAGGYTEGRVEALEYREISGASPGLHGYGYVVEVVLRGASNKDKILEVATYDEMNQVPAGKTNESVRALPREFTLIMER